jgi:hypothetical protein
MALLCCAVLVLQGVADSLAVDAFETHARVAFAIMALLCCAVLVLQGVADSLAVDAYETHARVALESNDLPEFRQCLARLKQLYRAGVGSCEGEYSFVYP